MTMIDAMALAVGVALALSPSFRDGPTVGGFPYVVLPPHVTLILFVVWVFWVGAASTSIVVAARLARYRRFPRPAEWLAILMSLMGQQATGPLQPIDVLTRMLPFGMVGALDTFSSWRWTTAGLATAVVALGLGLLRLFRRFLPPWARTAWLVVLAYLALAGPIYTIGSYGVDSLAPSSALGPGRLAIFQRLACQLVATTPLALMIGIPAVATLIERVRRVRWRWTEWACTSATILIALSLSTLYLGNSPFPSSGWAAEWGLVGAWLVGVGILSWAILDRLGPAWSRWLGDQAEEPGSTPIESSPASTFST
jgi:hypothetical protein